METQKQRYMKKYYQENKDSIMQQRKDNKEQLNATRRIYEKKYRANPERKEYMKGYWKQYRQERKEHINEYRRNKRNKEPLFKLQTNIRSTISKAIKRKGYTKRSKSYEILGCSFDVFKAHLEALFEPWMNWYNYGVYTGEFNAGWDIDHFKPLSLSMTEQDVIELNHYTNLRPLCSKVNRDIKKGLPEE